MTNRLEQLKKYTTVVADTGDFQEGKAYGAKEATTNPSLILLAAKKPEYEPLIQEAVDYAISKTKGKPIEQTLNAAMDKCIVNFGVEWLKNIPGRVSTEVDARLSFDTEGTVKKAKELIEIYKSLGIDSERVLIKIAATWEGIEAARQLEEVNIHTNVTLLFAQVQAIAAAQNAKATLISPFVGRIYDWYKNKTGQSVFPGDTDPGVQSVKKIYAYFKKFGLKTIVMGASFRNIEEIAELAGCDNLTISPGLLKQLQESNEPLERKLSPDTKWGDDIKHIDVDEKTFRWLLNEDEMATEKLAEGIRRFGADIVTLEKQLLERIQKTLK
ncbi:Transaldolase [Tritrichomonas foetus]|uniref:Transaldolase n=1 Tax=Tritrichomonas foetus TaxID=1144522 RepID=A0A1J4JKI2_9EUKA|nr:Transaldolase [Tritrichomonas foetus]|eukprot:OHS99137.1 Transaldolase [Tritrichomonas foetus]